MDVVRWETACTQLGPKGAGQERISIRFIEAHVVCWAVVLSSPPDEDRARRKERVARAERRLGVTEQLDGVEAEIEG
jgi:hypothetical protein